MLIISDMLYVLNNSCMFFQFYGLMLHKGNCYNVMSFRSQGHSVEPKIGIFSIKYSEKISRPIYQTSKQPELFANSARRIISNLYEQQIKTNRNANIRGRHRYSSSNAEHQTLQITHTIESRDFEPIQKQRRSTQQKKPPQFRRVSKDAARIPIQLNDEAQQGGGWQKMKGRVIYRGHMPKNSYYLLNNLKELEQNQSRAKDKNFSEEELQFKGKFQSGNLSAVIRISKREYYAFMREDTNTHGLRQWFYFQVKCNRPQKMYFRIYKFTKKYSLYRNGMKPYIRIENGSWTQSGEDISYNFDEELKCYYLSFCYTFIKEGEYIQIANMPPYTYSKLCRFIEQIRDKPKVRIGTIGNTLGGIQIPKIELINQQNKRSIIILSRTHPGQTCSSFTLQQIIKKLIHSSELINSFNFFIVPMINPDGVIVGNHRTSLVGIDLNRKFTSFLMQKDMFPQVQAVKEYIKFIKNQYNVEYLFDFHGHSAKSNIFAYGEEQEIQSQKFLKSRLIPKLLGEKFQSFKYQYCLFEKSKEKKSTARVYFNNKWGIDSITFQQSYGLTQNRLISIDDWKEFGCHFVQVLTQYQKKYCNKIEEVKEYLSDIIIQQKKLLNLRKILYTSQQRKDTSTNNDNPAKIKLHSQSIQLKQIIEENDESLSSGDESLQLAEQELDYIRKNMSIKRKQLQQRMPYEISDQSIQLRPRSNSLQKSSDIIHEYKMPLVSRILRMKQKQKGQKKLITILTSRNQQPSPSLKQKKTIKLPNIIKKLP